MRSFAAVITLGLCVAVVSADDPPKPVTPKPAPPAPTQIRFPEVAAPVVPPAPAPKPNTPTVINSDEWYVIDSDVECFVHAFPAGVLTVTPDTGPLRLKGKFVGTAKVTTRSFKGPFVYIVEVDPAATANPDGAPRAVDLVVIPKGVTTDKAIVTKPIAANVGPRPPPLPPANAPTAALVANPTAITAGASSTLTWTTTNATAVTLDGVSVPPTGSTTVAPAATTTYRLAATGAAGTAPATAVVVVVVTAAPLPTDPLAPALAAAFTADGSPAAAAKALAAVYRNSGSTVDDPKITTAAKLLDIMHAAAEGVAPSPALAKTRRVIADEFNKTIGGMTTTPLDAALRTTIKAQYTRMATLLEVLK